MNLIVAEGGGFECGFGFVEAGGAFGFQLQEDAVGLGTHVEETGLVVEIGDFEDGVLDTGGIEDGVESVGDSGGGSGGGEG